MEVTENTLRIRRATAEDAGILCRWWNDGRLMGDVGFPMGLGTTEAAVSRQIEFPDKHHLLILEVAGIPIGEANYAEENGDSVGIGIKIGCLDMQNKGYGTLFIRLMVRELFSAKQYDKIVLNTDADNTRAQRVYEKIGFKKNGSYADTWTDQMGNSRGHIAYELHKDDFDGREQSP